MPQPEKTAVILFNIGGPDKADSIEPYLFNFFSDPAIIRLPQPFRSFIARRISKQRSQNEAKIAYGAMGGRSPLLQNTQDQAFLLEKILKEKNAQTKVFISMRYWHPRSDETAQAVKDFEPDKIVLLPLYPQYSTATTVSSIKDWHEAAQKVGLDVPTTTICCYPSNEAFIKTSATLIRKSYKEALLRAQKQDLKPPRILFSAHGLPEKIVKSGDPYQAQCELTARKIVEELDIPMLDWVSCYQSRVGRLKWIGPSTEDEILRAGVECVPILVYPHAFVSEHVETLVEIEKEYRTLANNIGVPYFMRVKTVSAEPDFIKGLAELVEEALEREGGCGVSSVCSNFKQCPRQKLRKAA